MNNLQITSSNLPAQPEELARFILVGREKLVAVRAEIRAIQKIGLAQKVLEQKRCEAQEISEALNDAEVKVGEFTKEIPKARRNQHMKVQRDSGVEMQKTKEEVVKDLGFSLKQVESFELMAKYPEIVEQAKAEARANDDVVSRSLVLNMIKTHQKKEEVKAAERKIAEQAEKNMKPVVYIANGIGFEPNEPYDLLLTDPPYSTDVKDINAFVDSWLYNALSHVKPTGFAYVFIGAYPEEQRAYLKAKIPAHMKLAQALVWTYKNTLGQNPKDRYKQNYQVCLFYRGVDAPALDCPLTSEQWAVQEINAPDGRLGDRYHAWQKPMEIAERFIRHSTEPGMTVFDPFTCTGTFLLAAAKLGRKAYGFEINPDNAAIAFDRGCLRG